jgi:ABC-type amino acid transport substrate-binding protein
VTFSRRELVDFSLPTYLDGASVLSRISKPVRRFEDLVGKRVGVLGGTTSEQTLRQSIEQLGLRAEILAVGDHRSGLNQLWADTLDAYFADRGIIAAMLYEGGRPGFELSRQYFSYETYALALPRNDGAFRLFVDRTLARLYRTGRINSILARTFGQTPVDDLLKAMILINSFPD